MDLRFVSSLIAVIDQGSLAAAARGGGITASAVTQRVAALAAELQVPLLLRAGRRMQPTPQCLAVLPQLRQLLRLQAEVRAGLHQQVLAGPLRLGAISTALGDYAPGLVRGLAQHAPKVELFLTPGTSAEVYATFEAETLDAALIVRPPFDLPKTMSFCVIAQQRIGLLSPATPGVAVDLPYILYSRSAWGGAACWASLMQLEPRPRILAEMDALETIAQMVQDGLGRAVLPQWTGLRAELEAGLRGRYPAVDFTPLDVPPRELGMLSWARDCSRPLIQLLHQQLAAGQG